MAVTSVDLVEDPVSSTWNSLWQRTYQIVRKVECDNHLDGPVVIRTALSGGVPWLPRIGASYYMNSVERDVYCFLNSVDYERMRAGVSPEGATWKVTENYGPYDATTFSQNPVDWPLRVSFSSQNFERTIDYDANGAAIRNSAGDPFKDVVTRDESNATITCSRNELINGYDFTLADSFQKTVNAAAWNGFPAKSVRCTSITTSEPQQDSNSGHWFYAVTYVFDVDRTGLWQRKILDQGYSYLDGSSPRKRVAFTDKQGVQVQEPELLDGSGGKLAITATPAYLTFDVYPTSDFTTFNISFATALGR